MSNVPIKSVGRVGGAGGWAIRVVAAFVSVVVR